WICPGSAAKTSFGKSFRSGEGNTNSLQLNSLLTANIFLMANIFSDITTFLLHNIYNERMHILKEIPVHEMQKLRKEEEKKGKKSEERKEEWKKGKRSGRRKEERVKILKGEKME